MEFESSSKMVFFRSSLKNGRSILYPVHFTITSKSADWPSTNVTFDPSML